MSCADTCIVVDFDYVTSFFNEVMRRARKPYKCCECSQPIVVGEQHQYATGKTDGDFWDYRTCRECVEIRKTFCCGGWIYGQLWEDIREQMFRSWDEMQQIDCLARLETQAAIDLMRSMYARYLEDRS
jgi:hypothetical protein